MYHMRCGMLLVRRDGTLPGNPATHIVMQHRADNRSWAIPGGARDYGETFRQAAIREASEETSLPLDCAEGASPLVVVRREATLLDHGAWKYTTLVADVLGAGFEPRRRPGDVESLSVEWVPIDQVGVRGGRFWPLLPAFWEAWPLLLAMVRQMGGPVPAKVDEQAPPRPVDNGSTAAASNLEPPGRPVPTIVDNDDDDDGGFGTLCYWFIPAMP
ncbi:hypothetical protein UCDDA912_g01401 [Diaporthe ampelina]|uniref:Nudix hydrolase domain-containing protein n=1 Tax=Diaporthe ampelina TaxID=1214573 RepID=A0A0G2FXD3_9PEZI|nr:hypothetical protein UCDDA912_g01401 [Diaporthe ampelina]